MLKVVTTSDCHPLSLLMKDSCEAWYWIGFILADGCVYKKINRIKICLAKIDLEHLEKFCDFVGLSKSKIRKYKDFVEVATNNKVVAEIITKFDFKERKTYNPPTNNLKLNKLLVSLYMGFIDGDGSIQVVTKRSDVSLRIKNHASWKNWLINMSNNLSEFFTPEKGIVRHKVRITNSGYGLLLISDNELIRRMKNFCVEHGLPVMKRKWDKVNLGVESRYLVAEFRKEMVLGLKDTYKTSELCEMLGVSQQCISKIITGNKC